jgi:hypothetical protein
MVTAVHYHELPLVQWLYEHGCALSNEAALAAARVRNVEKLSWLHSKGCPCDRRCSQPCVIVLLQWVKDNGVVDWSPAALADSLNVAGVNGHLDTAKVRDEL